MNRELGTKWFTFYTKIRPVLAGLSLISVVAEFANYTDMYLRYWWLLLFIVLTVVDVVLSVIVWVKSDGEYIDFVRFVKGVLLFETLSMTYQGAVATYIRTGLVLTEALVTAVITLIVAYLLWYRLNVKYFTKRIKPETSAKSEPIKHGTYHILSEDVYFDQSVIEERKEISQNGPSVHYNKPAPANAPIENQVCRKCKKNFDASYKHCPYCGKKVEKKRHTFLIISISVILICVIAFVGYIFVTQAKLEEIRDNAFEAMYDQNFSEAKYYFDQYPDAEENFPTEYAYVKAGILMEEGKYLSALEKFKDLNYPVPDSILDSLTEKVYTLGTQYYHGKDYLSAQRYFVAIREYRRSEDYITLTKVQLSRFEISQSKDYYNELINLIGFEDAASVLLTRPYVYHFLEGTWRTQNKSHYFKMDEDRKVQDNLPSNVYSGTYQITNGTYRLGNDWTDPQDCFKFTIVEKDIIDVYCYKDQKTYRMYRE